MGINNYDNKYKDISPQQTINNIKNFFTNKNFNIIEINEAQSEIGTWSIHLGLYLNNIEILTANGKGMTQLFSKASGYAELYERYCNFCNGISTSFALQDAKKQHYQKTHTYFNSQEIKINNLKDYVKNIKRFQKNFIKLDDGENNYDLYYQKLLDNNLIALPFKNIQDQTVINIIPEFLHGLVGSDGMAAGNTLEEALVQGASEIYEHIIWNESYNDTDDIILTELNFDALDLPLDLKEKGKLLKKLNLNFKVIDYSYYYSIPVIGILLIHPDYNCQLILGAHPVFNIALERCFTEIYQGYTTLLYHNNLVIPSQNINLLEYQNAHFGSLCNRNCYNEKLFTNLKYKDNFNQNIFINNINISNQELLKYIYKINNNLKYTMYYYDMSQDKNIYAIHVFLLEYETTKSKQYSLIKEQNNLPLKKICIQFMQELYISEIKYLKTKDFTDIKTVLIKYKTNINDKNFCNLINDYLYLGRNCGNIFSKEIDFIFLLQYCFNNKNDFQTTYNYLTKYCCNTQLKHISIYNENKIRKYCLLYLFKFYNNYTNDFIKQYFKEVFNIEITDKDLELDQYDFFEKIYFEECYNLYHSQEYQDFIDILIP